MPARYRTLDNLDWAQLEADDFPIRVRDTEVWLQGKGKAVIIAKVVKPKAARNGQPSQPTPEATQPRPSAQTHDGN